MLSFGLPWLSVKPGEGLETRIDGNRTKHLYGFRMGRLVSDVLVVLNSPTKALVDTFANILVIL